MCRPRDQNLAAVGGRTDAGGRVHVHADVLTGDQAWLTCMETHSDPYRNPVRPCIRSKPLLALDRSLHCIPSPREGEEDPVAFGIDLPTASFLERSPQQPPVHHERVTVMVTGPLKQAGRPPNVGKNTVAPPQRKGGPKRSLKAQPEPILIDRSRRSYLPLKKGR